MRPQETCDGAMRGADVAKVMWGVTRGGYAATVACVAPTAGTASRAKRAAALIAVDNCATAAGLANR